MISGLFSVAIVLLLTWLIIAKRRPRNYPPGPMGFPILGHLPRLGFEPHKTLLEWKKVYGPVISVDFGSFPAVAINDTKMIKEALNMNAFSGRPHFIVTSHRSGGVDKGLLFTEGQHWLEQRRFSLHYLRDFGFGTKSMESKILDEVIELVDRLKSDVGKEIKLHVKFNSAVLNALWSIMVGERLNQEDPELIDAVTKLTTSIQENNAIVSLCMFIPWLAYVAPKLSGFESMVEMVPNVLAFIQRQIDKHNETYIEGQPRDFLDAYKDEMKKTKDTASSFHEIHNTILFTLTDLFIAATETTSTTLTWLLAYMIHFPEAQEKMYKEINHVVGHERLPSLNDRSQLSYTEAVIHETMRFSTLVPIAIFHKATEDVEFHGYTIPKDTLIIPNIYSVHNDKEIWGDPENFRPERFLDSAGKFKKNENLIPFSTGKRVCLGEGLARDELFLFTTCLFQKFKVCPAKVMPDLKGNVSMVVTPKPFEIILQNRV